MPDQNAGSLVCPDCGRVFSRQQGLTRHRNYSHPGSLATQAASSAEVENQEDQPAAPVSPEEVMWMDDLRRLAIPLQQEVDQIQNELGQLNIRRDQLMGRLKPIRQALDRLQGVSPGPKPGNGAAQPKQGKRGRKYPKARAAATTVAQVREYLEAHQEELADGFTGRALHAKMESNGQHTPSKDTLRKSLLRLHETGVVRLDRITQGGGRVYKLNHEPAAAGGDTTP